MCWRCSPGTWLLSRNYQSKNAAEERTKKNLLDLMRDQASRLTVIEGQVDSVGVVGAMGFSVFKAKLTWRTALVGPGPS